MQRDTQRKLSPTTNAELLARRQAAVAARCRPHAPDLRRARRQRRGLGRGRQALHRLRRRHRRAEHRPSPPAGDRRRQGAADELYTHTCFQVLAYEPYVELAEKLNALVPGDFAKKTLLLSTGAEAVENAVKIARADTGRPGIIAFTGGYHGRTMMTLGLTGKVVPYKLASARSRASVFHALFPNALYGVSVDDAPSPRSKRIFKNDIEADAAWRPSSSSRCRAKAASTSRRPTSCSGCASCATSTASCSIADEVQTGAGRTGTFFAMEQMGVAADIDHHGQDPGRRLPDLGRGRPGRGDGRAGSRRPGRHLCRYRRSAALRPWPCWKCSRRTSCWSAAAPSAGA